MRVRLFTNPTILSFTVG